MRTSPGAAIGRLLTAAELRQWPDGPLRSAFVISAEHVLTAWHCISRIGGESARVWLRLQSHARPGHVDVPLEYRQHSADLDIALLALAEQPPTGVITSIRDLRGLLASVALPLGTTVAVHDKIRIGGFPLSNPSNYCMMLKGSVTADSAQIDSSPTILLYVDGAAARHPENPRGMSGGPVLRRYRGGRERVVGVVYGFPPAPGGQAALGGEILARHMADVAAQFPAVRTLLGGIRRRRLFAATAIAALATVGANELIPRITGDRAEQPPDPGQTDPAQTDPVRTDPPTPSAVPSGVKATHRTVTKVTPLGSPLHGHTDWVGAVAVSPDGRLLASGSKDTTTVLWDITDPAGPRRLGSPPAGRAGVVTLVFRPAGHVLAGGSGDGKIWLWNTTDPAHTTPWGPPLTGHSDLITGLSFSPDGNTLISSGADRAVLLWDTTDPADAGRIGEPLLGHTNAVTTAVFSPLAHIVATAGYDATIRLWDVTNPAQPASLGRPLRGHTGPVNSVAFSPDGRTLATGSTDGTIRLWDITDPTRAAVIGQPLTGHQAAVGAIAVSRDWVLASGGADTTIQVVDIADPARPRPVGRPLLDWSALAVAFSGDGRLLVGGSVDRTVRLWRVS